MSRFYDIKISDSSGTLITTPSSIPGTNTTYTSYANNQSIPGALQIELDIPITAAATPIGSAAVRIWGITLQEIAAGMNFGAKPNPDGTLNYKNITITGGMKKGLPLANPDQAGTLVQGSILQAFGNWIGTEMTLDFVIAPSFGTNQIPANLVLDWKANTLLAPAILTTLRTAFGDTYKYKIEIDDRLKLNHDQPGYYNTLQQFSTYIAEITRGILGPPYPGVSIVATNGTIFVFDGTADRPVKQIKFQDLIGQPTWIEGPVMQFKTVMRGDIAIGDHVKMPQAIVTTTTAAPNALINLKSAFEGDFLITEIRHVGSFRQPTADAWVTVFNAATLTINPT